MLKREQSLFERRLYDVRAHGEPCSVRVGGEVEARRSPQPKAARHQGTHSQSDRRLFQVVKLASSSIEFEVMFYRGGVSHLRPLVILNPVEYPVPPSEYFCAEMWDAGYQVIFVRRPGFGRTTNLPGPLLNPTQIGNGAAAVSEAVLLSKLIDTLHLQNVALMAMGSANPAAVRLCSLCSSIGLSIFINPAFNQEMYDKFHPDWFSSMLRQIVNTRGGLRIAIKGLKATLKTRPLWLYRQLSYDSLGDFHYIDENRDDLKQAGRVLQSLSAEKLFYEISYSMSRDPFLKDGLFKNMNAVVVSAEETLPSWQAGLRLEADRLGVPLELSRSGNFFTPYITPSFLIELLGNYEGNTPA